MALKFLPALLVACLIVPVAAKAESPRGASTTVLQSLTGPKIEPVVARTGSQLHEIEPERPKFDLALPMYRSDARENIIRLEANVRDEAVDSLRISFTTQF